MHKLEDDDTGEIYTTSIACHLLDCESCQCSDYANRKKLVPDCVFLTPELVETVRWLPKSCAYRLVHEGRHLPWWHPLVSGNPDSIHEAGISVRGRIRISDDELSDEDDYIAFMTGVI